MIVDLTSLVYRWGDEMEKVFDPPFEHKATKVPLAVVVDEACESAINTLVHGVDSKETLVDNERFFFDADDAIEYLFSELRK